MQTSIHILINNGAPEAENKIKTREEKIALLEKKIDYAAECIEYDYNKEDAILFLQKLYNKLSSEKIMRDDTQYLMQKCYRLIKDYGFLPHTESTEQINFLNILYE